ncbi:MAG: S8 family peptidase [Bacteroidetes bacterium]|nr:S8 family peptidase [Bacteroidota bacterium]
MKKITFLTNWKNSLLSLLAFALFFSFANAQNPYVIQFQDETIEIQENIDTFEWNQMPDSSRLANGYFGWVQFYETPTQDIQDSFKNNDLLLIDYIPHQTYSFYFPETTSIQFLADSGVRAVIPVEGRFKMSQDLKNGNIGDWAILGNNILVTLVHHKNVNTSYVINELAAKQISVTRQYDNSNYLELSIPNNCLVDLSNLPYVKWIEVIDAPPVPDDDRGRGLHRSNGLDTQTGTGRNYTGDGIGVLTRDDGIVGPHVDFYGRIMNLIGNNNGTHGDGVSGIMAGAGNKDPTKRGMAAGADLFVVNYVSSFLDSATINLLSDGTVQVTNSSYSNGCNAGYTAATRTVDAQMNTYESAFHVFSAGNSNNNNCGYGAGTQWGNITGGHKQGKNVIATANTFYDGVLVNSSSRGPAHDGRIKPDIAANGQQTSTGPNHNYFGFGGTSGASPGIAGVSAQLFEVYADANGGTLPKGALIKAALLNSTNDAGNVGPDFKFGWGIVNGLRAGKLIEDGRYLSDNVSQGNTNTHNITVPSGTTQLRVMVHWRDVEASIGANPALVNDLDLIVTDPSNTDFEPWLLDHTPDPVLLNLPAGNGPDHLNNVEQVLINNPVQGTYDIDITGFNVPMGPQEYWVVWEMITENLTVTYPNGGEKFVRTGSLQNVIQWDAINTTGTFLVEYTVNGASWNTIGTVGATTYQLDWLAPDVYTGNAKIRVTSGGFSDESDDFFSITTNRVASPNIIQVCETDATFTWADMAEAESYDLWMMGDKFMEIVGNSTETMITVPIADYEAELWYAVAPRNDAVGWVGLRTIALRYVGGLLDCVILGVDDNDITNTVVLYPNPASTEFIVNLGSSVDGDVEITVINSLGQTIQRLNTTTTQTTIDVSNYHTGLYFVSIKTDTQSTTKKLLVM